MDKLHLSNIKNSIFHEKNGKLFIGGEELSSEVGEILKGEAEIFLNSRLFEILNSTIVNEAYDIALIQSGKEDFKDIKNQVISAKMLYHWNHVLTNLLIKLSKFDRNK